MTTNIQKENEGKKTINTIEIDELISQLGSTGFISREHARTKLLQYGDAVVEKITESLSDTNDLLRWEAVKILAEIHSENTITPLMTALEDEHFSVRWLAARGLIQTGTASLEPLLNLLLENPDSGHLREGVHHICKELEHEFQHKLCKDLIKALEKPGNSEKIELLASHLLERIEENVEV